ncbi:histidine kinase [Acaryochloris sp. IP29b_bin.137]|uniref:histidine kinase n=1 Tax=Acaryochloris sp. IP29b_bin.137 TaxID=2969217 RepID=UPI002620EFBE|nr:histidine kinase [Acaryochloris sp. IP29b_bin.137]
MKSSSEPPIEHLHSVVKSDASLQLLLFVDKRTTAKEQIHQISQYLETLKPDCDFELHVVEVAEQPYLVEHYKLVATPALVKIRPEPRHILAGSNLVSQLEESWPYWQHSLSPNGVFEDQISLEDHSTSFADAAQLMQLSDQMFRLRQENEALQDQLKFKDRMITMLAHDLRNPLTAATIALETLTGQWDDDNDMIQNLAPALIQRLTKHAYAQTQIIERMITNLLEASQGNEPDLKIHPKQLDLGGLCQEIALRLQNALKAKSQSLESDIPPDIPNVHADADQVQQVILNLLDNAMKYTPEGGAITLSVLHRTTQKVQVSICDNGLGIPQEKQQYIFDHQYRLDRDQKQAGYGMGLALCKRIVGNHYGEIWVDSAPNHGSCFHFTLPVYR